jgi:hypothetical protein
MISGRGISFQSAMLIPKEPLQDRRQKTHLLLPNSIIRTKSLCHWMSFAGKSQSPKALSLPAILTSRA